MRDIRPVGPYVDIVEGRSPDDPVLTVQLGLREASFQQNLRFQLYTPVAQYYGLVQDGLLDAIHLFQGIKRPLMDDNDKNLDKSVLVYGWRPRADWVWTGSQFDGHATSRESPPGRVFVVLVRPEPEPNIYPGIGAVTGSIEKWNWVKEDTRLAGAPSEWNERYDTKLWSRDQ